VAATISAAAAVAVAAVGVLGARAHQHTRRELAENTGATREVLHQVKNDHGTNLRDDLDRLTELVGTHTDRLAELDAGQARIGSMLGGVRKTVDRVQQGQRDHDNASLLIVSRLEDADRQLAAEIRHHHPTG
jgi:hypothetical protein